MTMSVNIGDRVTVHADYLAGRTRDVPPGMDGTGTVTKHATIGNDWHGWPRVRFDTGNEYHVPDAALIRVGDGRVGALEKALDEARQANMHKRATLLALAEAYPECAADVHAALGDD